MGVQSPSTDATLCLPVGVEGGPLHKLERN